MLRIGQAEALGNSHALPAHLCKYFSLLSFPKNLLVDILG